MIWTVFVGILNFIGALSLLLFGMEMLSTGIQKGAGNSLQKLLGMISGNRFTAVLTGLSVTALIQSSGATTVMVVSFVNADIISLTQAIGIIFGANIGTTVTAWIVSLFGFSFSISAAAIPLFGIGFLLRYLKKYKIHNFANVFMGFALLFLGLGLLSESLKLNPSSMQFIQKFDDLGFLGILIGVVVGAVVTALIHSSSATSAIVLTMAYNGSLSWRLSAAIVLGSNIGSTIDAILSALNASTNAKRAAAVHLGFNVIGTILALCVFNPFLNLIDFIVPGTPQENITNHIAMLHTMFNTFATIIFLPFINQIAKFVTWLIKDKPQKDNSHYVFPIIMPHNYMNAELYSFQIEKEITRMASRDLDMFDEIYTCLSKKDGEITKQILEKISAQKTYVGEMQESILDFLAKASRLPTTNQKTRDKFYKMMNLVEILDSLGDECCSIMKSTEKYLGSKSFEGNSNAYKEIVDYLESVHTFFELAMQHFVIGGTDSKEKFNSADFEEQIDKKKKQLKKLSRHRIEAGKDVKVELNYIDMVRRIEKAGDCIFALTQNF